MPLGAITAQQYYDALPVTFKITMCTVSARLPAVRWVFVPQDGDSHALLTATTDPYDEDREADDVEVVINLPPAYGDSPLVYFELRGFASRGMNVDFRLHANHEAATAAFVNVLMSVLRNDSPEAYTAADMSALMMLLRRAEFKEARIAFAEELCVRTDHTFFARCDPSDDDIACDPSLHDVLLQEHAINRHRHSDRWCVTCTRCAGCGGEVEPIDLPDVAVPGTRMHGVVLAYIKQYVRGEAVPPPVGAQELDISVYGRNRQRTPVQRDSDGDGDSDGPGADDNDAPARIA